MELDTVRCSTPLGFCSVKIIRPGYKQSSLLLGASLMNKKKFCGNLRGCESAWPNSHE
jgi:hypothetical protein